MCPLLVNVDFSISILLIPSQYSVQSITRRCYICCSDFCKSEVGVYTCRWRDGGGREWREGSRNKASIVIDKGVVPCSYKELLSTTVEPLYKGHLGTNSFYP